MKRRIIGMLLVLTLVLGLASCGAKKSDSKNGTLSAQFEKVVDMKASYAEITIDIDTDLLQKEGLNLNKFSLKLTTQGDKDNAEKAQVGIEYKLDSSSDFKKLTTMIVDKNVVYINLKELKAAANDVLAAVNMDMYAAYLSMIPDTEYVKIDPATLSSVTGTAISGDASSFNYSEEDTKVIAKISTEISKAIEEAVKDVNPAVITGGDDKILITLSDKNVKAALEALAKADYSKCFDNVIGLMEEVDSFKSFATLYKGQKDTVLKELKTELENSAKSVADANGFEFNYSIAVTGSEGNRVAEQILTANVAQEEGKLNLSAKIRSEEGKTASIEAPADAMDFMEIVNSLMGGATGYTE